MPLSPQQLAIMQSMMGGGGGGASSVPTQMPMQTPMGNGQSSGMGQFLPSGYQPAAAQWDNMRPVSGNPLVTPGVWNSPFSTSNNQPQDMLWGGRESGANGGFSGMGSRPAPNPNMFTPNYGQQSSPVSLADIARPRGNGRLMR